MIPVQSNATGRTASGTAIAAHAITHVFGEGANTFTALKGVDFRAQHGEIVLIMGPSGSGKTTLVQIIGGLLTPTGGQVLFGGQDVARLDLEARGRLRLKHFGFVFQAYNLFPTLTARENVMVALDLLGQPRHMARNRAGELLDSVGLGDRLDSYPAQLSGGQKQRVAIARALANDPDILIADEPTAALDAVSGQRAMELFRTLSRDHGRAVIIVTHDPRILPLGDRIVFIEDGRIQREETGAAISDHHGAH